ncbi:MAG: threonylcarbamoyl-AMP synthase [Actinobacteria bacterium]|uniref:L-threonylcarbamoyladenylate synthase n=1 Tax=freshwater metagenome TaxID=449393 RepID=A0A6J6H516_9ZZZZ|nr:threonylcarbamoyl-AMP synthase [Actinomycetota bacterium]
MRFDASITTELLEGMRQAKQTIGRAGLIVLPTDTVYGIGCDAFSAFAVNALLEAKGRGRQSPPPVLIPSLDTLRALTDNPPAVALTLAEKFWPGALTMILRAQPSLSWDLGETRGTVALRMPNNELALALLKEVGPLAVSSANLTGEPAANNVVEAENYFGTKVGVYLDGGASPSTKPSTIVDLTEAGVVKVVRLGVLSLAQIKKAVGKDVEVVAS